jgi:large subunit ribosomal protein L14
MIQQETILKVADNSGAKTVKCIKVLGGFKRKFAYLGDIIIVSIKTVKNFSKVRKGEIYKALIIRTKQKINKKDGCSIFLYENSVSLISKQGRTLTPVASRIFGPVPKKLAIKFSDFTKISGETF